MSRPPLLFQNDAFATPEEHAAASAFFELQDVSVNEVAFMPPASHSAVRFRGSLFLASRLHRRFEFASAVEFYPPFRKELLSPSFFFLDAPGILETNQWPLFIRPTRGDKAFAGGVFSRKKFEEELAYLTQNKNYNIHTLCVAAPPNPPAIEWRCVFVNGQYVSGSQYMVDGDKVLSPGVPPDVESYAKNLAGNAYFINIFDFVLDIARLPSSELRLIEVNAFETSDFYSSDLLAIYSAWSSWPPPTLDV